MHAGTQSGHGCPRACFISMMCTLPSAYAIAPRLPATDKCVTSCGGEQQCHCLDG